jgi:hypothetical protein
MLLLVVISSSWLPQLACGQTGSAKPDPKLVAAMTPARALLGQQKFREAEAVLRIATKTFATTPKLVVVVKSLCTVEQTGAS